MNIYKTINVVTNNTSAKTELTFATKCKLLL